MIGTSPALDSLSSISPSFTTQSSDNNSLSDIAARVVAELQNDIENNQNDDIYDQFYVTQKEEQEEDDPEEEKEFEFAVVRTSPSVTADVTTPLRYPLFDRSLLLDDDNHDHDESMTSSAVVIRRPLRMLFNEERETTTSCSSSESDDLEGVTPGTYCVWKPKDQSSESSSPDLRKKSNSTGNSSKRWKTFKKLLSRSNSHDGNFGKNDVLSNSMGKKNGSDQKVFKKVENTAKVAGADDEGEPGVMVSVSDDKKSSNRFKSYLSYKQAV